MANDIDFGHNVSLSPVESMVNKQVAVRQGHLTITGMLAQVAGNRYRVAYGPVKFEFCEADILSVQPHEIVLKVEKT